MARKKTVQPNTPIEPLSRECTWLDYMSDEAFRFFPQNDHYRQRLIFTMYQSLEEADKKGRPPIDVMQFCVRYKIPYETLLSWSKKYEDVGKAYRDYKLHLGANRRIGVMHNELKMEAVYKDQHHYDPQWDEVNKYHAALKNDEIKHEREIVVIERMPDSKMVPEKKK